MLTNVCFLTMRPLLKTAAGLYLVLMGKRPKNTYDAVVQQELPDDIKAALARLASEAS